MRTSKVTKPTPTDTGSTTEYDHVAAVTQTHPLAQYINDHKLPGRAANDPTQFALSDFLFKHMQQRANAQPE